MRSNAETCALNVLTFLTESYIWCRIAAGLISCGVLKERPIKTAIRKDMVTLIFTTMKQ